MNDELQAFVLLYFSNELRLSPFRSTMWFMKTILILALVSAWTSSCLFGQSGRSITVKAGEDIAQAWSPSGFYRSSQFRKAVLFRKEGQSNSNALFNYNIFSAKIQFINETGDTLDLINPTLFDSIVIGENVFYYDEGFLELVASSGLIRLVKRTQIKMRPETVGAYGATNSTGATDKVSSYSINGNMYSFSLNQNMTVKESTSFFFMNENGKMLKATKNNLLLLLPADKQEYVKLYLNNNKVSFEKEGDLKKMLGAL
jgi:hypothetical protein